MQDAKSDETHYSPSFQESSQAPKNGVNHQDKRSQNINIIHLACTDKTEPVVQIHGCNDD